MSDKGVAGGCGKNPGKRGTGAVDWREDGKYVVGGRGPGPGPCPTGEEGIPGAVESEEESSQSSKFVHIGDSGVLGVGPCPRGRGPMDEWDPVSLAGIRALQEVMGSEDGWRYMSDLRVAFHALVWMRSHGYYLASRGERYPLDDLELDPEEREAFELESIAKVLDREVAGLDRDKPDTSFLRDYYG